LVLPLSLALVQAKVYFHKALVLREAHLPRGHADTVCALNGLGDRLREGFCPQCLPLIRFVWTVGAFAGVACSDLSEFTAAAQHYGRALGFAEASHAEDPTHEEVGARWAHTERESERGDKQRIQEAFPTLCRSPRAS
jgi:hypothetical protein